MRLLAWLFGVMMLGAGAAHAAQPEPWGLGLQEGVTPVMAQIRWFEGYTLIIITAISLFVLALLILVVVRYRASVNKDPSRVTHNTMLEVVWTIVPVLILVAIAFPSFRLLFEVTDIPKPDMTVKAIAAQWYWNYEYMDEAYADIPVIVSNMLKEPAREERKEKYGLTDHDVPRLLAADFPLVVPEGATVHLLTTSMDVNHAVAMPAFGLKQDSVQGRLNEMWFKAEEPGIYYGQCSELCGRLHAFMPLEFRVLTQERFDAWTKLAAEDLDKAQEQLMAWQVEDRGQAVAQLAAN